MTHHEQTQITVTQFQQTQKQLLHIEYTDTTSNNKFLSLNNCNLTNTTVGLYGKTIFQFHAAAAHDFTVGTEVQVSRSSSLDNNNNLLNKSNNKKLFGVVVKVAATTDQSIYVALGGEEATLWDDDDDNNNTDASNNNFCIQERRSDVVRRKMEDALDRIDESHPVARFLFTNSSSSSYTNNSNSNSSSDVRELQYFNKKLDKSQRSAIEFALHTSNPITLIHGPPGTGKTTTLVELLLQVTLTLGLKVLVCSGSNVAVDLLCERFVKCQESIGDICRPVKVARIGHPARLQPAVLINSLDALIQNSDSNLIIQDIRKEIKGWIDLLSNKKKSTKHQNYSKADRYKAYQELKLLRKEVRQREDKTIKEIISSASVIFCTNVGASSKLLQKHVVESTLFDLVVIDEAAQALEASCWIPILLGKKVILAGDHKQLPPTILSQEAKEGTQETQFHGLDFTLFDRVMSTKPEVSRMLDVQYRMHRTISDWSSKEMYGDKLQPAPSVAGHLLTDLSHFSELIDERYTLSSLFEKPMVMIDTAGCEMEECSNEDGSRFNEGEADLVCQHVEQLLRCGLKLNEIAVITPYNGQCELLRSRLLPLYNQLEIRSVDGFQGGEKEAVILSLVRSNNDGVVGFLADDRRMNVAITRARRHLFLICDSDTVSRHAFIGRLVEWIEKYGDSRSAMEFDKSQVSVIETTTRNIETTARLLEVLNVDDVQTADEMTINRKTIKNNNNETTSRNRKRASSKSVLEMKIAKEKAKLKENNKCNEATAPTTTAVQDYGYPMTEQVARTQVPNNNKLLAELAQERMVRQQTATRQNDRSSIDCTSTEKIIKTEPKTYQKPKRKPDNPKKNTKHAKNPNMDIEDDMAFLDAEVQRVQTSHGRKIEANGNGYKSIMNGILLPNPKVEVSRRKSTNSRAAAALKTKIKDAESNRKVKSKNKSKK